MPSRNSYYIISLIIIEFFFSEGCKKKETIPVLKTNEVSNVTIVSVQCGGKIVNDGGGEIMDAGICWSTGNEPTINDSRTIDTIESGIFKSLISGLSINTIYFLRAYARNIAGTGYGEIRSFHTLGLAPAVSLGQATNITRTSATLHGIVNANNLHTTVIFEYDTTSSFKYSVAANPNEIEGYEDTEITVDISNLIIGAKYYFRIKAENSLGITYGSIGTFNAISAELPVVTLSKVIFDYIMNNSAREFWSFGSVEYKGNLHILSKGVCWSENPMPTVLNNKNFSGPGTGSLYCKLLDLHTNTTYYVRDFAITELDTVYSNQLIYTTPCVFIEHQTASAWVYAIVNGDVDVSLNPTIMIQWDLMSYDLKFDFFLGTQPDQLEKVASNVGGVMKLSNLQVNTTYYWKYIAWQPTNPCNSVKSDILHFTTIRELATTILVPGYASSEILIGVSVNHSPVSEGGVCWGVNPNPEIMGTRIPLSTNIGSFTYPLTGLASNTTYYVKAFAVINSITYYGSELSYTAVPDKQYETVTDIDGNVYHVANIGTQTWLAENLRATHANDGTELTKLLQKPSSLYYPNYPSYYWVDFNDANKVPYGAKYNWNAVAEGNLCPVGWHIPDISEWKTLLDFIGNSLGKLKEPGTTHWASPNVGATNETGFNAIPTDPPYNYYATWWTSTQRYYYDLHFNTGINLAYDYNFYTVRCLKNK